VKPRQLAGALLVLAAALGPLPALSEATPLAPFVDQAGTLGIRFQHETGAAGAYLFPEITGAGAALVDVDGDGDLDAYLVQSGALHDAAMDRQDRLYLNELDTAGRFVDVTDHWLPPDDGYGIGVIAGDVNNDGHVDLYVTNYGKDRLLFNQGGAGFVDATVQAGLGVEGWSTSAAFADIDGDDDLDLYVAHYVSFDIERNPRCFAESTRQDYCGPSSFPGQADRLFRNEGSGRFTDITLQALGNHTPGAGLGVVAADFDDDGDQDFYVANDGSDNHLWMNDGNGVFRDDALFRGVAVNATGRPEASMGIAIADYDEDADLDLFLTHLMGESNTLYRNDGSGNFEDHTASAALAAASHPYTGWGTAFVDLDFDGRLDLVTFNGAVRTIPAQRGTPWPFVEANQAWLQTPEAGFREASDAFGADFQQPLSARGAAFGDIDNDGDVDILVSNAQGPAQLFVRSGSPSGQWVGVEVWPPHTAQGALVGVRQGGKTRWRRAGTDGSFASSGDPRVRFFGPVVPGEAKLLVRWPGGQTSESDVPSDSGYLRITRP
jgi:hypothetical protein